LIDTTKVGAYDTPVPIALYDGTKDGLVQKDGAVRLKNEIGESVFKFKVL